MRLATRYAGAVVCRGNPERLHPLLKCMLWRYGARAGVAALAFVLLQGSMLAWTQAPPAAPAPVRDADLDTASNLIGQALILRCFAAADNLSFNLAGQLDSGGKTKVVDWTLAGVNVQKVERRSPTVIELDGVRAALRFAPDRREWERHAQKDEAMRLLLQDPGDPRAFRQELAAVFSVGIDRALQRSTSTYWQHYFDPQMPWPADDLLRSTVYVPGKLDSAGQAASAPVENHKAQPAYTTAAQHDRVQGVVQLQFVVGADGATRRIVVQQPLGYGLDAEAAKAAARMRFAPAEVAARPVAAYVTLRQEFALVPAP